jgi:hypothetical protein
MAKATFGDFWFSFKLPLALANGYRQDDSKTGALAPIISFFNILPAILFHEFLNFF